MIQIITSIDPKYGVDAKNQWLVTHGLQHGRDWTWNFCDRHTKHIHMFTDEHDKIAILFALKWG